MGCTSYQRLASEHEKLSQRLTQIFQEKQTVYEDKIQLESEVFLLRKNVYDAVNQAESMKKVMDCEKSTEYPEIFESAYDAEVIGDWLEMDLRDGDKLLEALTIVYPPASPSVLKLQSQSVRLRRSDSSLRDYLAYFSQRFELFYSSWREILSDQKQVETVKLQLKQDLAAAIQRIEGFVGKRSDSLNGIHSEFRRICELQTTDFLREHRNMQKRLSGLMVDMYAKKLEEKDVERQRVIHLLETEIQKLTQRRDLEIDVRIRAEISGSFEERIAMISEDLLSSAVKHHADKELIQSVLTEEIEQRVEELKQMKNMHKHDKAILTRKYAEETNALRKENDGLKRDLLKVTVGSKEELRVFKETSEKELIAIVDIHNRELADRDNVLTELKEDFLRKSNYQKSVFEEKLAAEKEKFAAEITKLDGKVSDLAHELTRKEALLQESEENSSELMLYKLVSGLLGKITLTTLECESKLAETYSNLTPNSPVSLKTPSEPLKNDSLDRTKEAESALLLLSQQGKANLTSGILAECWKALTSDLLLDFSQSLRRLEDFVLLNYRPDMLETSREVEKVEEELKELRGRYEELGKKCEEQTAFWRGKAETEAWRARTAGEQLRETLEAEGILREEMDKFTDHLREKSTVIDKLTAEIQEKNAKILELDPQIDSIPQHFPKSHKDDLQSYPVSQKSLIYEENEAMQKYIQDLTHKDAQNQLLAEAQQAKEAEIQSLEQRQKLKTALNRINFHIKTVKRTSVFKWKLCITPQKSIERGQLAKTVSAFSLPPLSPISSDSDREIPDIDQILAEEQRFISEKWSLTGLFRSISRSESPMLSHETFEILNELLDEKFELDCECIRTKRVVKSVPMFVLERLAEKYGSEKQARKVLGQVLMCLLTHIHENQPYAYVICALLNFGVRENASVERSAFIVKSRMELRKFVERFDSEVLEKRENVSLQGGMLLLSDAFEYLYESFAGDQRSGELALRLIRPEAIAVPQFVLFAICHKMAKAGITAEDAFQMLDKRNVGIIALSDFTEGIPKALQIWASQDDLCAAFSAISSSENYVHREEFLTKLAFEDYILNRTSADFAVSRAHVLKSLLETAASREREVAAELLKACGDESPVSFRRFSLTVLTIDPGLSAERVKELWYIAEELAAPGQVSPVVVVRVLLRHRVGEYAFSPFCKFQADESRLDPTVQQLSEHPATVSSDIFSDRFSTPIRGNGVSKAVFDPRASA